MAVNGAENYREAERILATARSEHGLLNAAELAVLVAEGHVHAILALAAATALSVTHQYVGDSQDVTDWARIVQPKAFKQEPCTDGCVDDGRNGCYARCIEARANAKPYDTECPF